MAVNHHFSEPVELREDKLFTQDRRHNALDIRTGQISGSNVRTVTDDDDQLDDALRAAGANILGQQYPYARAGFVRRALRPVGRAAGRDRWR